MRDEQPSRRRFLGSTAAAATAGWVAPTVLSVRAAGAATCVPATFLGFAEALADGDPGGTVTRTLTVTGVPTAGVSVGHVAVGNVDHIIGVSPQPTFTTPPGWTLLGFYDSDVTTPGTTGVGSTAFWSQRVYVWYLTTGLSSSYSFDVTVTGGAGYTPQARVVVAAFDNVGAIADDAGEFALQGSGTAVDPTAPPPTAISDIPSITLDQASTYVLGLTGGGNVSTTNTLTPPTGYTTVVTANTGTGYPPIFLFSAYMSVSPVPATTATVAPGAPNVGGQLTIECS